jgi:hypothetical protein
LPSVRPLRPVERNVSGAPRHHTDNLDPVFLGSALISSGQQAALTPGDDVFDTALAPALGADDGHDCARGDHCRNAIGRWRSVAQVALAVARPLIWIEPIRPDAS